MSRRSLLAVLTVSLLTPPAVLVPAMAQAAGPTGTAVEAEDVATVSESSEGEATGLEVGDEEVTGTDGDGSDHLASSSDVGVDDDDAEVTVLHTEVDGDESSADTATVGMGGDDGATATALSSQRDGDSASTTGVRVAAGDDGVALLHSEADSQTGRTVVADLDGTEIGVNEQDDDRLCTSELPTVIKAELLCASGGDDGGEAIIVDDLTVQEVSAATGLSVDVLRANGVGDGATVTTSDTPDPDQPETPAAPAPPTATSTRAPAGPSTPLAAPVPFGDLPVTGAPALAMLALGLSMLATGTAMLRRR